MNNHMNAEKLFEALGELDEEILNEASSVDSKESLVEIKANAHRKIFFLHPAFSKIVSICVCVAIIAASVFTVSKLNLFEFSVSESKVNQTAESTSQSKPDSSASNTYSSNSVLNEATTPQTTIPDSSSDTSSVTSTPHSSNETPSVSDSEILPPETPEPTENFSINSIDMLNFYSAKKVISDNFLLPISNSKITYNEIDRYAQFTVTMATYFTITLNDENGFLAQKLGGTGEAEVVITQNNLDNMITFKRDNKYFSCLWNSAIYSGDSFDNLKSATFSTHKYIKGFNVVKNLEQENYQFTVHFEGSNVTGIECQRYNENKLTYEAIPDIITLTEDYCVVMYVEQSFTIDQLEVWFNKEETMEEIL